MSQMKSNVPGVPSGRSKHLKCSSTFCSENLRGTIEYFHSAATTVKRWECLCGKKMLKWDKSWEVIFPDSFGDERSIDGVAPRTTSHFAWMNDGKWID